MGGLVIVPASSKIAYISFFSGIGGWDLGASWAGARFNNHFFSEINHYAVRVFQKMFPDAVALGDITKFKGFRSQGHTQFVFTGSFPCIDLSIAGKRRGLQGDHSGLWFDLLRLINACKPLVVLVENVKDLVSMGLDVVISGLVDAGYICNWRIISAADVGAPHLRERLWLVAYRNDLESGYVPFSFMLNRRIDVQTGRSVMRLEDVKSFDSYYVGTVESGGLSFHGQPVGRNMPLGGFTRGNDVYAVLDWEVLKVREVLENTNDDNGRFNAQRDNGGSIGSGGAEEVGAFMSDESPVSGSGYEDVADADSSRRVGHVQHEEAGLRGVGLGCEQYSELEGAWDIKPGIQCVVNGIPWYVGVDGQPIPFPVTSNKRMTNNSMLSCYGNALLPQIAWILWRRIKPFITWRYLG
jgi:DNA (cytosine-5)-methyltransferase 1